MLNRFKQATPVKNPKQVIEDLMGLLRRHPQVLTLFARFGVSIDEFDQIEVGFKAMDVSAKTRDGKIWINKRFLEDGDLVGDAHYICHEIVHWLQQRTGLEKYHQPDHYPDYLSLPTEIQAFREQIQFIRSYKGEEAAQKYLDELLDFHELKGAERKERAEQLCGDLAAKVAGFGSSTEVEFFDEQLRTTVMVRKLKGSDVSGKDPSQGFADFQDPVQAVAFAKTQVGPGISVGIYLPPDIQGNPEQQRVWQNTNDEGWAEGTEISGLFTKKLLPYLGPMEQFGLQPAAGTKTAAPSYVQIRIQDRQGRELEHHYLNSKKWGPPAGRIEAGEKPLEAAARELEERSGFAAVPADLELVGESEDFYEFAGAFEDLDLVGEPQTEIRWGRQKTANLGSPFSDEALKMCGEPLWTPVSVFRTDKPWDLERTKVPGSNEGYADFADPWIAAAFAKTRIGPGFRVSIVLPPELIDGESKVRIISSDNGEDFKESIMRSSRIAKIPYLGPMKEILDGHR